MGTVNSLHFRRTHRPSSSSPHRRIQRYRRLVPKALRDPGVVVTTPTEAVADEVAEFYALDRARVVATPLGVASHWYDAQPASAQWLAEHRMPERYLLFVGSLEPRKN